ncbi:MAG: DedA family protein [Candidatus Pacebacteria bacterium]|nr:DedA family protein [Candidatus Paceibacterota bacterium]
MIQKLVSWTEAFAKHKHNELYLFAVAFTESSFFLIPPDVLIIAILSHGIKVSWLRIASISTVGSVLGGIFGYLIGSFFYTHIGEPVVVMYGLQEEVLYVGEQFKKNAFLSILVAAFTPIPYKVFTISAGLFSLNLFTFIGASIVGRGARFFLVAFLADRYGEKTKEFIVKKFDAVFFVIGILILFLLYFVNK